MSHDFESNFRDDKIDHRDEAFKSLDMLLTLWVVISMFVTIPIVGVAWIAAIRYVL